MNSGRDDRRVKYTRMVLKESFIKLLEKKEISQISIKEICEDADINRSTFYAHYNDQYDLLRKIEDELLDNIKAYVKEFYEQNNSMDPVMLAEKIFEYLKANANICRILIGERGNFGFQKQVMMLVYDLIIADLTDNNKNSIEDAEYVYSFAITGCIGIVQKWLDDGMKKSAHFMAETVVRLTLALIDAHKRVK